ncbi:hypothetical protein B0H16DRAFT_1887146 [Mycena metata]|uniref:F-box domain-containing protein n=1 Tax=Mycena metata TaxID=1033252 RepID=A0AAD7IXI7_9AGAR|nr:hypothetical protein B0H16DRAFT_1887146 [Mycena metata]
MNAQGIPDELWLEIFQLIPHKDLVKASLAFRAFYRMTRPLIFSHFDFWAYTLDTTNGFRTLAQKGEATPGLPWERLDFWSSGEIAPYVRSCTVTSLSYQCRTAHNTEPSAGHILRAAPPLHRAATFQYNRRVFHAHDITNLGALSALTQLDIDRSKFFTLGDVPPAPHSLTLSSFTLRIDEGITHWMRLLRPDSLLALFILSGFRIGDLDDIPCFPRVHKLSIMLDLSMMSYNLAVLAKFPGVQSRRVGKLATLRDMPIFSLVSHNTSVARSPWPSSSPVPTSLPSKSTIASVRGPLNISSVDVHFTFIDNQKLDALFAVLPRLVDLCMFITTSNVQDARDRAMFFHALPATPNLPSTLRNLAISWDWLNYTENDQSLDFSELHDALVARCPFLTSLWFDGYTFLFHWHQMADGTVKDGLADNFDDAEITRESFEAFWDAR